MASLTNGKSTAQIPSSDSSPEYSNLIGFCEGSFVSYRQFLSTFDTDKLCTKPAYLNNTLMAQRGEFASPHQHPTSCEPESCNDSISRENPFSYSPGQLNKLLNPKGLGAFEASGGYEGLQNGLSTNCLLGLPLMHILIVDWQYGYSMAIREGFSVTRFISKSSGASKGIVKLLAFLQMIAPAFASDGAVDLTIHSGTAWPSSEKPSTLVACTILILINICTRIWPNQFRNSVMAWFLLCFSTLAMWCVVPDIIASKTLLLCFLVQQLNLCHLLAQGSHTMVPGHPYTMSVHLWPIIGILTLSEAYFSSSSWVWTNQSHWLVSTIPWLGVNVLLCIYFGCLWTSYIKPWLFYHRAQAPVDEGA